MPTRGSRAWELVGDRATDVIASIAVLTGHEPSPDGLPAPAGSEPTGTKRAADPESLTLIGADHRHSELY
jgi:hypothetical protein